MTKIDPDIMAEVDKLAQQWKDANTNPQLERIYKNFRNLVREHPEAGIYVWLFGNEDKKFNDEHTKIMVYESTKSKLERIAKGDESYDAIINRLIELSEVKT